MQKLVGNSATVTKTTKKIMAVASGGGHWVQLLRIVRELEDEFEVCYVTVNSVYSVDVPGCRFHVVMDATRWSKFALLISAIQIAWIVVRERPRVIVSTGAAPGYFAIVIGHFFGIRTAWVDSIANIETMSLSGEKAGKYANLWLTQWPHLARAEGPYFMGAVL
jgi:UDP-N-acetylglucosamine:LPS N-acetylglucosamine transferase